MARFGELMDTVFYVLRKSYRQLTPLHLYHHSAVLMMCWISFKYNGMIPLIRLFLLLNTTLHMLLYGYHVLSHLYPVYKTKVHYKRWLTQMEILQFVICGIYYIVLFIKQTGYPMEWICITYIQNILFTYLFYKFYNKTFGNKSI